MPTDFDFIATRPAEPVAARAASSDRRNTAEPEPGNGFAETYQAVQNSEPRNSEPDTPKTAPTDAKAEKSLSDAAAAPAGQGETAAAAEAGPPEATAADAGAAEQPVANLQLGPVSISNSGVDPTAATSVAQASAPGSQVSTAASAAIQASAQPLATAAAAVPANALQAPAAKTATSASVAPESSNAQAAAVVDGEADIENAPAAEPKLVRARIDLAAKSEGNFSAALSAEQGTTGGKPTAGTAAATSSVGRSLEQNLLNLEASGRDGAQVKAAPDRGAAMVAAAPLDTTTATSFAGNGGETQAVQPASNVQATQATAVVQAARASQHQPQQPAAQQVAVTIARAVRDGADRIEMQLHPAELGRVDVKMELGHDGRIMAVISAEKTETLESLRRDVHQLEKALADAGFDMNQGSFQFEENDQRQAGSGNSDGSGSDDDMVSDPRLIEQAALANRMLSLDGLGLDIRV